MVRVVDAHAYWNREAETMPRRELDQLQLNRLRGCVERLRSSGIRHYRERLERISTDMLRTPEDLTSLPFATKQDLREHYPFGLVASPSRTISRVHASSGSTGRPTVVAYTKSDLDLWADVVARGLVAGGVGEDDVIQIAAGYGLFTGGLGWHEAVGRVGAAVVPTGVGNTVRQVTLMRDFEATAFISTSSYSVHLSEVAEDEGIDILDLPLRAAFLGAEPMSEKMRRQIEARMGVTVYEGYGLSEIIGPGVATECGRSEGMHVWEDHFVPEIVDPDTGEPLPEGEIGELVLSAPTKEALPLLRYRTGDLTRLMREPCPCGRTSVRISRILGRTDDMLIVRGINVFPSQVEDVLLGITGLEPHYQIVLCRRTDHLDDLLVRVEVTEEMAARSDSLDALKARTIQTLRDALNLNVVVELVPPRTLKRSEGKAARVLDQRASISSSGRPAPLGREG